MDFRLGLPPDRSLLELSLGDGQTVLHVWDFASHPELTDEMALEVKPHHG